MKIRRIMCAGIAGVVLVVGGAVGNAGHSNGLASTALANDPNDWTRTGNAIAAGNFLGSTNNIPLDMRVNNLRAFRLEPGAGSPNIIGGHNGNFATAGVAGATIAGGGAAGQQNRITDSFGTIGGGRNNQAGDAAGTVSDKPFATVSGGYLNLARESYATVSGGRENSALGTSSVVAGGQINQATATQATVGGGANNSATGVGATIGGGYGHTASAPFATIGGGGREDQGDPTSANRVTDAYGTIGGGGGNLAGNAAGSTNDRNFATVGGGRNNSSLSTNSTIGGGYNNSVNANAGTIAGGDSNEVTGMFAVIGGGHDNGAEGTYGFIGGGNMNVAAQNYTTIAGGLSNDATAEYATIGGGIANAASGQYSAISGGRQNAANGQYAFVGSGAGNLARGHYSVVGGGGWYSADQPATGNKAADDYSTVGGGVNNIAGTNDANTGNAAYAVVSGGANNHAAIGLGTIGGGGSNDVIGVYGTVGGGATNTAGERAVVPGGEANAATGTRSFAAGYYANALHAGSFVWADNIALDFNSTAANQWSARARGGARFVTAINPAGAPTAGVTVPAGGGAWASLSDRNAKTNIVAVDSQEILEKVASIPMAMWNYKTQDASVKHIGPMAQDFAATFGVGDNDTTISTIDADGVALAAIQGLYSTIQERDQEIAKLRSENTALHEAKAHEIMALEARLTALERSGGQNVAPSVPHIPITLLIASVLAICGTLVAGRQTVLLLARRRI